MPQHTEQGKLVNMLGTKVKDDALAAIVSSRLNLLRDERNDRDLGQVKLAQEIGIPTMTLNRALNARAVPAGDKIVLIAKHYGVTTDWLYGIEGAVKRRRKSATV